ncbi:hypothetical protein CUT44_00790 [Streptomyces carminius]|uniref:Uncharacterized protein n=1 Tax=Streptomyces carminius TaxID=2665496 RepID=A0A2M8MCU2_9ACTN|nr:hypothetical protein CUT44_00790 [Streptomyces carminius]
MRTPVRITTAPDGGAWNATILPDLGRRAGDDLRLLIDLIGADPVFTLRFEDGKVAEVVVERPEDPERLRLESPAGTRWVAAVTSPPHDRPDRF